MSLSSAELWQRIAAQQLASPMQCRSWAAEASAGLSASEAIDGSRMATQLVALGKLSQFQADVLLSGSDQSLARGGWRLIEPVNFAPLDASDVRALWNDWWVATKTPTSPPSWVRWLTAADLEQANLREANPSLPLALRHSQVAGPHLQAVSAPEMAAGALQVGVAPLQGKLFSGIVAEQPKAMSTQAVMQLLLEVSAALAALHATGIAHGRVAPDRLSLDDQGAWQLLRDPLCGATFGLKRPSLGLLGSRLPGKLSAAHFMAPEFLLPAQAATPQTDCYGLGCVAWLALTGQPPVTGKTPEQILAAHADQQLDVRKLAHVPEPLTRCLLHCLAKNPEARFAGATQLHESLLEAQRLLEAGPVAAAKPAAAPSPQAASPSVAQAAPVMKPAAAQPQPTVAVATAAASATERPAPVPQAAPAQPTATAAAAAAREPAQRAAQPKPVAKPPAKPTEKPAEKPAAKPVTEAKPVAAAQAATEKAGAPSPAAGTAGSAPAAGAPKPAAAQRTPSPPAPAPTATAPVSAAPAAAPVTAPVTAAPVAAAPVAPAQTTVAPVAASAATAASSQTSEAAAAPAAVRGVRSPGKGKPPVRPGARRAAGKRKKNNQWLVPAMGAGALVALLLLILVLNGGLGSSSPEQDERQPVVAASSNAANASTGAAGETQPIEPTDPRAEYFELVGSDMPVLWAPPREPEPLPLDLLPPGGQMFVSLRPADMFAQSEGKELLGLLDADIGPFWKWLSGEAGMPVEAIDEVIVAAYAGQSGAPQFSLRVHLATAKPLGELKTAWGNPTETKVGEHAMLTSGARGYYVAAQPLVDSQSVAAFSVGPAELVKEAVELQGAVGPLTSQLEHLWQWTDRKADVSVLLAPSFLFTEGRQLVERAPERLADQLVRWLSHDMRGVMLNTSLNDQWYYEVRLAGASDRDAGALQQKLSDAVQKLPQEVESWFVDQSPHPYWRAIALRFPNMLRAMAEQTRFGVEDGEAVANGYLPAEAAPNLLYASWIALQPSATTAIGSPAGATAAAPASQKPLTAEQILDRPITVIVDQQGIEVVLQLIGEQANEKLPPGTKPLLFELDGPAFQRAGFTRNQQLRDFKVEGKPVRAALTELARRGNPVPDVTDLHSDNQKMVWVLTEAADKPGEPMVSLTSREAATAAKKTLPVEFAAAAQ